MSIQFYKTREDRISSDSLSITSSFKIDIPDTHEACSATSEPCGPGLSEKWKFRIEAPAFDYNDTAARRKGDEFHAETLTSNISASVVKGLIRANAAKRSSQSLTSASLIFIPMDATLNGRTISIEARLGDNRNSFSLPLSGYAITLPFSYPRPLAAQELDITVALPRQPPGDRLINLMQGDFLTKDDLVDTKFHVFTKLRGRVASNPKPIYAMSQLLLNWSNNYLNDMLTSNFGGEVTESYDRYDYESDSDMDLEEDGEEEDIEPKESGGDAAEGPVTPVSTQATLESESKHYARVIPITGTAFKTWKAFIGYLYTGKITFAPLRSERSEENNDFTNACSPKSIYRLAHECEFHELKDMALEEIKKRISTRNIVEEMFSRFTARYPEVREFESVYLTQNIDILRHDLAEKIASTSR